MLDLVYDDDLNPAFLEIEGDLHKEHFLGIAFKIIRSACPNDSLKQRFGAVPLGGIDHDDRNTISLAFHLWNVVGYKPVQVGRLSHPGDSPEQEITLLAK